MRAIAAALLLVGCYNPSPPSGAPCGTNGECPSGLRCIADICTTAGAPDDASDANVTDDVGPDAPACASWQARHFDACALPASMGALALTTQLEPFTWDTDAGTLKGKMNTTIPVATQTLTQVGGPDVLLVSVDDFSVASGVSLDVTGSRPLLIAANGTVSIDGVIHVISNQTGVTPECPDSQLGTSGAAYVSGVSPATGGGGGAFQGNGGTGGNTGGTKGTAIGVPTVIRGGCSGGRGGAGSSAALATRGGGGGALEIAARVAITVNGTIRAPGGGGGAGAAAYGGAGGGGSGGYLGFDAPSVILAGTIAANGGGGGGGASDVGSGGGGFPGGTSSVANGGGGAITTNVGTCADGGAGSFGPTLDGTDAGTSACGGSGGGGGAGYVLVWSASPTTSGLITPAATTGP